MQGGRFFVVNRSSKQNDKSPSAIIELELDIRSTPSKPPDGRVLNVIKVDATSLSGLQFDAETNTFYIASDDNNMLLACDTQGNIQTCYKLPGQKQEGVTSADKSSFYIADDKDGLVLHVE